MNSSFRQRLFYTFRQNDWSRIGVNGKILGTTVAIASGFSTTGYVAYMFDENRSFFEQWSVSTLSGIMTGFVCGSIVSNPTVLAGLLTSVLPVYTGLQLKQIKQSQL
jgi:hypothetical protein